MRKYLVHSHIKDVSAELAAASRGEETGIACSDQYIGAGVNAENIKKIIASESARYPKGNLIPKGETHLNALPDCWAYLPPEYDVDMKRTLPVTAAFEKSRPKADDFSKGIKAISQSLLALF